MKTKYNNECLPPYWKQITNEEFAIDFFCFHCKQQKSKLFFYDENGEPLKQPFIFTKIWDIEYPTWEGLGLAICWHGNNDIRFYRYGDPKKWETEKALFNAIFVDGIEE